MIRIPVLVVPLLLAIASQAAAQESRAAAIAAQQDEKSKNLHPYVPPRVEQIVTDLTAGFRSPPSGFFPYFGSIYSGGGFTLGAGYRGFTGDNTLWEVRGLYSIKNYKNLEVGIVSREHARRRLNATAWAGFRDATQVAYYGLGIHTIPDARTNFRLQQEYATGALVFKPIKWVVLEGKLGFENYLREEGTGSSPSIEQVFDDSTAPGIDANPAYVHTEASAGIDWRTAPGYSRRGGLYEVRLHDYSDTRDDFSFRDLDVNLVQHIPILRENWVISLRGQFQSVLSGETPFFLLPSLGSGRTLRGYRSWRFRDRHAMLMAGEFRWIPSRLGLDMALFYDAGTVAPERRLLNFHELATDWGIGARFHAPAATVLRIEAAHGREGWVLVFSSNAPF
jgi:hypothetical protein